MVKKIMAADLFCGAGGTSTGLAIACREAGRKVDLLAINHWPRAIETHTANHPWARHLCMNIDSIDPRKEIPGGKLDLLVASPECTHHSVARGSKPINDQSRASAWNVLRWAELLPIDSILIENVKEFVKWGPVDLNGKRIMDREGETFRAFMNALKSLGYQVEHRFLTACDYGDPTSRTRLFIQAVKGTRRKITWPNPTHSKNGGGGKKKWRTAREIIDWTVESRSIFNRKRPLAKSTLDRIAAGLTRFSGKKKAEPFLVMLYGTGLSRSVDRPLPTVTSTGTHIALCEPFIVPFFGEREGQDPRTHSVDEPLPAVTSHGAGAVVEPFLVTVNHGKGDTRCRKTDEPLPTITGKGSWAVVEPFLVKYYRTGKARPLSLPIDTVTGKARFALVQPRSKRNGGKVYIDIRLRMLQPSELAAAMGFPKEYQFTGGKTEKVKQIGNAVAVGVAKSLCSSLLGLANGKAATA